MLFVRKLLEDYGIEVELPIPVFVDNIGAIQMVRNNKSGAETRHVNVRFLFMRELNGSVIVMKFVGAAENEADIITKNTMRIEFEKYSPKMVGEVPKELCVKEKKGGVSKY